MKWILQGSFDFQPMALIGLLTQSCSFPVTRTIMMQLHVHPSPYPSANRVVWSTGLGAVSFIGMSILLE